MDSADISFKGKTVLVTGAARGIGFGIAREFARHGASVALVDILADDGNAAASSLQQAYGGEAFFYQADVCDRARMDAVFAALLDKTGRLDACIANAGIIRAGTILDLEEADLDAVLAVNLKGVFHTCQVAARHMVACVEKGLTDAGAIIPVTSTNAVVAIANQLAYVVSKGAVSQMTKAMALALAEYNIRVNAIGPGSVMSDVLKSVAHDEKTRHMILGRTPLGRIGEPEEIGRIAVFLASSYASYITGQTLYADGGRLALNYTVPVKGES